MMIVFARILITVLFSTISVMSFSETLSMDDLVFREPQYYKKFSDEPFTGTVEDKLIKGRFYIGYKAGKWIEYHSNGQLKSSQTYYEYLGIEDGDWHEYYNTGQIKEKKTFKVGKKDGEWREYYSNGQLKRIQSFNDGKKDGEFAYYLENGKIKQIMNFKDDVLDGLTIVYDENGNLVRRENIENGRFMLVESFHENGKISYKSFFNIDGVEVREGYDENGLVTSRTETSTDKLEEYTEIFHKNGFVKEKIFKKQAIHNGSKIYQRYKTLIYDEKENLKTRQLWENNKIVLNENFFENEVLEYRHREEGEFEYFEGYHPNGLLSYKSSEKNGKQHGLYVRYEENGQLFLKENYKDGKLDGVREEFTDGVLSLKETYKNDIRNGAFESYQDGIIQVKVFYVDGLEEGIKEYYVGGHLKWSHEIEKDKLHGLTKTFYDESDKLASISNYQNGILEGISESYDKEGKVIRTTIWEKGKKISCKGKCN